MKPIQLHFRQESSGSAWITATASDRRGLRSSKFYLCLDTGSVVTCVPRMFCAGLRLPRRCQTGIVDYKGMISFEWTHGAEIELWREDKIVFSFRPARGVFLKQGYTGLLGMDMIFPHFRVEGEGTDWVLIPLS